MSTNRPDETAHLEELGTPKEVRDARPALYPEHAALDEQGRRHPEVRADYGPDDTVAPAPRSGATGVWNTIAYYFQYAVLFVWGAGSQSRTADPIQRLKRRYGREEKDDNKSG